MGKISQWFASANRQTTLSRGQHYEKLARSYLEKQGLVFQCANFRAGKRELDLIMKEAETLVFVEVKFRQSASYGGALHALSSAQMNRIRQAASIYMKTQHVNEYRTMCRFDFIAIDDKQSIQWIKNAF